MADPSGSGDRPVVALLFAAALAALVTLGLVLRFGLVQPPALPPVDDATRPGVALALSSFRDGQRGQCIDVVEPDGTVRELRCGIDGGPLVGWDERGILMLRYASFGERLEVIDPTSGATVASGPVDPGALDARWALGVDIERSGATITVRDDERVVLWEVDAPDNYMITASVRDPATGTIALLDEAGRLLVLGPAPGEPRVWVDDVGTRYGELVWQGTAPTAD